MYGYASKTLESGILEIDDQIRVNRYSIIAMNNYAANLFKAGEYGMFFKVAPAVAGGNIALDLIDGLGTVGSFLLNGALQVKEPLDDLANYMLNVHNTVLEKGVNYSSPDRYAQLSEETPAKLLDNEAMYGAGGEHLYKKEVFPEPEAMLTREARILGTDRRKMSKSYNARL